MKTAELTPQILGMYLGQKVGTGNREPEELHSVCTDGNVETLFRGHLVNYYKIEDVKLILRPLSKMTEDEAINVADLIVPRKQKPTKRVYRKWGHLHQVSIMGGQSFEMRIEINPVNYQIGICSSGMSGGNSVGNLPAVYNYLRSIGIDCDDLIPSGVAFDATNTQPRNDTP